MKYLPWTILALVVAGVAYWYVKQKQAAAAAAAPNSEASVLCQGAAAVATKGLSMSTSTTGSLCNSLAPIITPALGEAKQLLGDAKSQLQIATSGVKGWEYAAFPVAATHITINEAANVYSKAKGWLGL